MKFAQTTTLALLATSTFAAPAIENFDNEVNNVVLKREEVNNMLSQFSELKALRAKRDSLLGDEVALMELDKRAGSVLDNLITSLISSGLLGKVFSDITGSPELKSAVGNIAKSVFSAVLANGGALITGVLDSHVLQDTFSTIVNDADLRSAVIAAGEALLKTALSLVTNFLGAGSSSTNTAAPAAPSGAAKRDLDLEDLQEFIGNFNLEDLESFFSDNLNKRDLASLISTIFDDIVNKIKADPQGAINVAKTLLHDGLVIGEEIFNWAKSSGLISRLINFLANSSNGLLSILGKILGAIFGSPAQKRDFMVELNSRDLGSIIAQIFDSIASAIVGALEGSSNVFLQIIGEIIGAIAGIPSGSTGGSAPAPASGTTTPTTVATSIPASKNVAANIAAVTSAADPTTTDDLSFLSAYAVPGATTLFKAKRMAY